MRDIETRSAKAMSQRGEDFHFAGSQQSMESASNSTFHLQADQHSLISRHSAPTKQVSNHNNKYDAISNSMLRSVLHRQTSRSTSSVTTSSTQMSARKSKGLESPKVIGRFTFSPVSTEPPNSTPSSPVTSNPDANIDATSHHKDAVNVPGTLPIPVPKVNLHQRLSNNLSDPSPHSPASSRAISDFSSLYLQRRSSSGSHSRSVSQFSSSSHISFHMSIRDYFPKEYDNESLANTLVSTLQPSETIEPRYHLGHRSISAIMGSVLSLPTSLAIVKDDLSRMKGVPATKEEKV